MRPDRSDRPVRSAYRRRPRSASSRSGRRQSDRPACDTDPPISESAYRARDAYAPSPALATGTRWLRRGGTPHPPPGGYLYVDPTRPARFRRLSRRRAAPVAPLTSGHRSRRPAIQLTPFWPRVRHPRAQPKRGHRWGWQLNPERDTCNAPVTTPDRMAVFGRIDRRLHRRRPPGSVRLIRAQPREFDTLAALRRGHGSLSPMRCAPRLMPTRAA
jgi:hypothetical protein